jgi:hypothetical protein
MCFLERGLKYVAGIIPGSRIDPIIRKICELNYNKIPIAKTAGCRVFATTALRIVIGILINSVVTRIA